MYIKIHIFPGARSEQVKVISSDQIEVYVKEPAKNNRANKRLLEIMHTLYPHRSIRLISGHTSPHKIVSVEN